MQILYLFSQHNPMHKKCGDFLCMIVQMQVKHWVTSSTKKMLRVSTKRFFIIDLDLSKTGIIHSIKL